MILLRNPQVSALSRDNEAPQVGISFGDVDERPLGAAESSVGAHLAYLAGAS